MLILLPTSCSTLDPCWYSCLPFVPYLIPGGIPACPLAHPINMGMVSARREGEATQAARLVEQRVHILSASRQSNGECLECLTNLDRQSDVVEEPRTDIEEESQSWPWLDHLELGLGPMGPTLIAPSIS
ncbi:hypothetical protein RRG08_064304 [Elysia crispata]|uniref:Uncharacterized protein n=1 Tax=Elysia crispata TaxID=231223 RepID=A0AAE1B2Q9_9GAST|nr:hypothetical protein RRG08_064304 [Elysia crispata]